MALTSEQVQAVANEAQRQALRTAVATGKEKQKILAALATVIGDQQFTVGQALDADISNLVALESSLGPGVAANVGEYSTTDQAMRAERFAGKAAAVDYVKANPGRPRPRRRCVSVAAARALDPPAGSGSCRTRSPCGKSTRRTLSRTG
jgi:hypothetical protein